MAAHGDEGAAVGEGHGVGGKGVAMVGGVEGAESDRQSGPGGDVDEVGAGRIGNASRPRAGQRYDAPGFSVGAYVGHCFGVEVVGHAKQAPSGAGGDFAAEAVEGQALAQNEVDEMVGKGRVDRESAANSRHLQAAPWVG